MKYFHSLAPQLDILFKASLLCSYLLCERVEGGGVRKEREEREKVELELPDLKRQIRAPPIDSWRSFAQISLASRGSQLKQC